MQLITATTERLVVSVAEAAGLANDKVLTHPSASPAVVRSGGSLNGEVTEFHRLLGVAAPIGELSARRWSSAVADIRDQALESGADRAKSVWKRGGAAYGKARAQARRTSSAAREHAPSPLIGWLRHDQQVDDQRDHEV